MPNDEKIHDFRDPKVMWHEASQRWVMTLTVGSKVRFYTSPNLINWTYASDFGEGMGAHGGMWECPDLIPMNVEGSDDVKYVLVVSINPGGPNGGSGTQYFVGDFDGKTFVSSQEGIQWLDYGTDNYAGVTWNNSPQDKPVFIGWMSNWYYAQEVPTYTWRSAMTLPRELNLIQQQDSNYLLCNTPIDALDAIEKNRIFFLEKPSKSIVVNDIDDLSQGSFVIKIDIKFSDSEGAISLKYGNDSAYIALEYNKSSGVISIDRSKAGYEFKNLNNNILKTKYNSEQDIHLEIWVDRSSMEVFVDKGKCVFTQLFFPKKAFDTLECSISGTGQIVSLDVFDID